MNASISVKENEAIVRRLVGKFPVFMHLEQGGDLPESDLFGPRGKRLGLPKAALASSVELMTHYREPL